MKRILSVLLVVLMTINIFACGNSNSTINTMSSTESQSTEPVTEQKSSEKAKKVGILMPNTVTERWSNDGENLKKGFEHNGYEVYLTYSDNKVDKQISDIEELIAKDVNLLIISAVDSSALTNVLRDAKKKNIPVIAYDRFIMDSDAVSYYVSFDNYAAGKLQGEFVEKQLDLKNTSNKYNIEFFAGDSADNNALLVYNGAYDVLKPYIEKGTLVVQSGQISFENVVTPLWSTTKATDRMKSILGTYYASGEKLDVALCSSDSIALGVTQAIESDYKGDNNVIVTGEDGAEASLKNIVIGKQSMTVYKAILSEATIAVNLGDALIRGEKPDGSFVSNLKWGFDFKYDASSFDNGTGKIPSYIINPTIITKENLQKELIDTGYYHMEDGYPKAN